MQMYTNALIYACLNVLKSLCRGKNLNRGKVQFLKAPPGGALGVVIRLYSIIAPAGILPAGSRDEVATERTPRLPGRSVYLAIVEPDNAAVH